MSTQDDRRAEEAGKAFRVPPVRPTDAPVGTPDDIGDVTRRQFERGAERQPAGRKPPPIQR